jgi:Glycosyltransferase WbsX
MTEPFVEDHADRGINVRLRGDASPAPAKVRRSPESTIVRSPAAARRARAIALYLPQFHPIPENDAWWGAGFTEWTNTAKAKPMFRGHYQPHVPADLGFYDLRVPETREAQADMARRFGIEGFCYYHYWFAGRRILERPFNEVLQSGRPDFPFCVCWANGTWTGVWHGAPDRVLIEQTYPGRADHEAHFRTLLPAFSDPRYIRVDGRPVFLIYDPKSLPDVVETVALWRAMAVDAGLGGLYMVGMSFPFPGAWNPVDGGFDARVDQPILPLRPWVRKRQPLRWLRNKAEIWRGLPAIHSYRRLVQTQIPAKIIDPTWYPCLIHAWDNTPRSQRNGVMVEGATPELFRQLLERALEVLADRPLERRLLFLKSWNEWAEGNHLEPDLRFGTRFLEAVRDALAGVTSPAPPRGWECPE